MAETALIKAFANGGEAVGTLENGKTVFLRGAIPGERVSLEIVQNKKRLSDHINLRVLVLKHLFDLFISFTVKYFDRRLAVFVSAPLTDHAAIMLNIGVFIHVRAVFILLGD